MPKRSEAVVTQRAPVDLLPICGCAGCQPLEAEFQADPVMLSFLKRTLLKRGWTGVATPAEKAYQRAHSTWMAGLADRAADLATRTGFGSKSDGATETPEFGDFPATETVSSGDAVSNAIMAQGALL